MMLTSSVARVTRSLASQATTRRAAPLLSFSSSTSAESSGSSNEETERLVEEFPTDGEWTGCSRRFMAPLKISTRGSDILHDPLFNKGTAFKMGERDRLSIRGLLPAIVSNMTVQIERFMVNLKAEKSDIRKYLLLEDLHDRNETMYHRVLVDNIEEMAPLIYTPTVGQACKEFAHRFRRPRGMYFCEADRGHMAAMVHNWPHRDVHVIVVTDGSRILGLGDLGANGMGIPIGKLSLYCAAGGIAPHRVLPVVLDVGTDNEELQNDRFYMGIPKPRVRGKAYFQLVDEFMLAVRDRWPNVLVQFEDFSSDKAQTLLNTYRHEHLTFNDDIQGTGATTLAGVLGAMRAKGDPVEALSDQRIVIVGAGSAGIGVSQVLKQAMLEQGRTEEEASNTFFIVDENGLLGTERLGKLSSEQQEFARDTDGGLSLLDVIKKYKPTILMGMTAVGGLFKEDLIREMAANCDRPIIFPLSNPTTKAECTAEQAFEWTDGRCIFAAGSPFDPVTMKDGRTFYPTQCNNMYVFPGLGLGVTVAGCKRVTDRMLYVAAEALANFVTADELKEGKVFPHISTIREVSLRVAVAVAREAIREGQASKLRPEQIENLEEHIRSKMYYPEYVPLIEKRETTV